MSALVIFFRAVSLIALASPALREFFGRRRQHEAGPRRKVENRSPVIANFAAFGVFFSSLMVFSYSSAGSMALALALAGCLFALAGAALVLISRIELGSAWSLAANANQLTGLVTSGPYRLVRHPIYLGFTLIALGQALAFGSWPSLLIVVLGVVPTFVWRAHAEERLLSCAFGERYAVYRRQTKIIVPYVL